MSLLSPRVVLIGVAGLSMVACAKGMGGTFESMDSSANGGDDGGGLNSGGDSGGNSGQSGGGSSGSTGAPQCMAPTGTCAAPTVISAWMLQPDGMTRIATLPGDTTMQCSSIMPASCPSSGGPETVYLLAMPAAGKLTLNLQAGVDPAVSQWPATVYVAPATGPCADVANAPAACQAAVVGMPWAPLMAGTFTQGQQLFVYVDGLDPNAKGGYTLTATVAP